MSPWYRAEIQYRLSDIEQILILIAVIRIQYWFQRQA